MYVLVYFISFQIHIDFVCLFFICLFIYLAVLPHVFIFFYLNNELIVLFVIFLLNDIERPFFIFI